MLIVFLYSLMCYGLSSMLVYYEGPFGIFSRLREAVSGNKYLDELFSCMFCLPVNIGIVMSLLSVVLPCGIPFTPFTLLFYGDFWMWPLAVLFDGLYTGAVVSIIDTIVSRITSEEATLADKIVLHD